MRLIKGIRKYNLSFFFFLVSIFLLCFSRMLFIISLWPWFFFWILEGDIKNKINKTSFQKGKWAIILLPSILGIFVISLIWSDNIDHGMASLGEKFSLILIPFFITFSNYTITESRKTILIRKTFIASLVCSSILLLLVASVKAISIDNGVLTFNPVVNKWENVFLYYNFTYLIHPSYYAMMHLLGLSFCLLDIKQKILFKKAYINLIIIIYFVIIIILSSSRAGYIALLAIILYFIISLKIKSIIKIATLLLIVISSVIYINHTTRFKNIIERYESNPDETGIVALFKTNIRYDLWLSSFNILKDNPILGSGIGDIQDDLNELYYHNGIDIASVRSLNAHNQFLESWLAVGIAGLIILLLCLILPLTDKTLVYKELYYYFFILISINFLFESMLNRLWGVAFLSIFYCLLTTRETIDETP